MIRNFCRLLARLGRRKDGNVAMMFALLAIPMVGSIGLAVDFGQILTARNKAQVAADAAALQAGGVALELISTGDGSDAATAAALAEGKRRGSLLFSANASQLGIRDAAASIVVTRDGQNITSRVEFQISRKNFIAGMFGRDDYTASGTAVSAQSLPTYSDVHIAVDISQSMGIAATKSEMLRLFNAKVNLANGGTKQTSCVFGCHAVDSGDAESYSDVAARLGIRLRIDVLRDATLKLVETAREDSQSFPIYRIAIYAMGMTQSYTSGSLLTLHALSGNFSTLATAASLISLGPSKGNRFSDSYQNETVAELNGDLTASGDGSSQAKAKKYVILITDGVRDVQKGGSGCVQASNRCVSALEQASCTAMKAKGITIGVLYTTYLPPDPIAAGTNFYKTQVVDTGVAAKIQPALKNCASPGWFFEASDASAINVALDKMFKQTRDEPALTQ